MQEHNNIMAKSKESHSFKEVCESRLFPWCYYAVLVYINLSAILLLQIIPANGRYNAVCKVTKDNVSLRQKL